MSQSQDWQDPSKRQKVAEKLDEAIRSYPGSLHSDTGSQLEETLFQKAMSADEYNTYVGRSLLSLTQHRSIDEGGGGGGPDGESTSSSEDEDEAVGVRGDPRLPSTDLGNTPGPSGGIPGQQPAQVVWQGGITVTEPDGNFRQVACQASAKPAVAPFIQAETWPQLLDLTHYPIIMLKQLKDRLDICSNTACSIAFQFTEPLHNIESFRAITNVDPRGFGILSFILQRNEQCHLKAMILVWVDRQFCGIVPHDQETFAAELELMKLRYEAVGVRGDPRLPSTDLGNTPGPGSAIPGQQPRQVVWQGCITVTEPDGNFRQVTCQASAKPAVAPFIRAETWPQLLDLTHYPKIMLEQLKDRVELNSHTACLVIFQFTEPVHNIASFNAITNVDPRNFGILSFILQRNEQCHFKAMILVWTDRQFCGIVPHDQETFVAELELMKLQYEEYLQNHPGMQAEQTVVLGQQTMQRQYPPPPPPHQPSLLPGPVPLLPPCPRPQQQPGEYLHTSSDDPGCSENTAPPPVSAMPTSPVEASTPPTSPPV